MPRSHATHQPKKQILAALEVANHTRTVLKTDKKKRVAYFHALGYSITEIAEKLGVSYRSAELYLVELRKQWHDEIASISLEDFIATLMLSVAQRKRRAQNLYASTSNDSVKLGALKLIGDEDDRMVNLLQSLGQIYKSPTRISIDVELENKLKDIFKNDRKGIAELFSLLEPSGPTDGKDGDGPEGIVAQGETKPD